MPVWADRLQSSEVVPRVVPLGENQARPPTRVGPNPIQKHGADFDARLGIWAPRTKAGSIATAMADGELEERLLVVLQWLICTNRVSALCTNLARM